MSPAAPLPPAVAASIAPFRDFAGGQASDDLLVRGLASWGTLLGTVSLELFGHLHNVVEEDPDARSAFFDHQMRQVAIGLGLAAELMGQTMPSRSSSRPAGNGATG